LIRTGKCDFGQSSIFTAYRQIVAEELSVPVEKVTTVITGDTDTTPDGGGTFGLLRGAQNLRKAAAYIREAVLELGAQKFGVPRGSMNVTDGVVSGGGKSETYGKLVAGQIIHLTIPVKGDLTSFFGLQVAGDPPLKPTRDYTIVGQPVKNPILHPKISGEAKWVGDVKLPGMLHARIIHPATLGSTLVSPGAIDRSQFRTAQVVVVGNLVGVVAEDEWEAIRASRSVAANTKWSEWKGLPGHGKLFDYLQNKVSWDELPASNGVTKGDLKLASSAAKTHEGSYFFPYMKHAPISPTVSLADVKSDGSVTLHTHSQNPQFLRSSIAKMLGNPESGDVKVERIAIVMDLGIVVNPLQLKRQVEAGCLFGVGQALHEEVAFDEGAITSANWRSYPILTMAEMPEVKVIIAARPEAGEYGQGSESANALAAPAIASAFFDATGKPVRRIPLRPEYVKAMLAA